MVRAQEANLLVVEMLAKSSPRQPRSVAFAHHNKWLIYGQLLQAAAEGLLTTAADAKGASAPRYD